jgi:hypothetical protein
MLTKHCSTDSYTTDRTLLYCQQSQRLLGDGSGEGGGGRGSKYVDDLPAVEEGDGGQDEGKPPPPPSL